MTLTALLLGGLFLPSLFSLTQSTADDSKTSGPSRISDSIIAVGIAHKVKKITLEPRGEFSVIDQMTGEMKPLESGKKYVVEADSEKSLILGPHLFTGPTRLLPAKPGEFVFINGRKYKGNIVFRPNKDATITAIDELGIEEYLYGVLPKEMGPDWPMEALKAQAVVSRTFALSNLSKYSAEGFDLSDGHLSQMYSGLEIESDKIRSAVRETRGQVLYWDGKLLPVFFHSCSGGRTTDPGSVWGGGRQVLPPLRGVRDRYSKGSPHYKWAAYFRKEDILRTLQRHGVHAGRIRSIRPGARDSSGRIRYLRFELESGIKSILAAHFRLWIGASQLKSTRIHRVIRRRKGFEFVGRGYGHGVGLSQWGARTMAEKGRDYSYILAHYFPGAASVRWKE